MAEAPPGQFSANWPGRSSATSRSIIPSRRSSQQAPPGRIGVQPGVIERAGRDRKPLASAAHKMCNRE
jgi:hypothetical protein